MKIGITVGDACGIGPEIVLKALKYFVNKIKYQNLKFVIFASPEIFYLQNKLKKEEIDYLKKNLNILFENNFVIQPSHKITIGKPSEFGGIYAYESLKTAYSFLTKGEIDVLATAPIDKKSLFLAKIKEIDHTQILKKLSGVKFADTLFKTKNLNIYFYSKHIPFTKIASALNKNDLHNSIERSLLYNNVLKINKKPLAIAALNPHGSDNQRFGNEETEIITPVIKEFQKNGKNVIGPIPADSVFAKAQEGYYSSVLSLYHDQGHIAAKTLDFYKTVSFTLGLNFLRTSVDHGSAMDIAGQNKASAVSMICAIKEAAKNGKLYRKRWNDLSLHQ